MLRYRAPTSSCTVGLNPRTTEIHFANSYFCRNELVALKTEIGLDKFQVYFLSDLEDGRDKHFSSTDWPLLTS